MCELRIYAISGQKQNIMLNFLKFCFVIFIVVSFFGAMQDAHIIFDKWSNKDEDGLSDTNYKMVEVPGITVGKLLENNESAYLAIETTDKNAKSGNKFEEIKKIYNCPILTDVHNEKQCKEVSGVVDILQIPAFLCRQTDLLIAAAKTNKIINVKKGQFLAPWDMVNVTKKISDTGNKNILVTERGASFGYNTLVSDMRSLPIMAKNGYPVIFDATHSVQQPGGLGEKSGGQREFVEYLARAAVAVGVAGVFIETHQDPDNAPSDGPNMVPLNKLENLLKQLSEIDNLIKNK